MVFSFCKPLESKGLNRSKPLFLGVFEDFSKVDISLLFAQ